MDLSQRQRIAEYAAVVAREWRNNAVQRVCKGDHCEMLFRNGIKIRETMPLWKSGGSRKTRIGDNQDGSSRYQAAGGMLFRVFLLPPDFRTWLCLAVRDHT